KFIPEGVKTRQRAVGAPVASQGDGESAWGFPLRTQPGRRFRWLARQSVAPAARVTPRLYPVQPEWQGGFDFRAGPTNVSLSMDDYSDAVERGPVDFFLFAMGFFGFILGVTGVILTSPVCAGIGGIVLLLAVWSFVE